MTATRVWAPRPSAVALLADGVRHPMTAVGDGWWEGPALDPGARYGFLLDDDPTPRPDPRGRSLPDGVHGLSEKLEPTRPDLGAWEGRELADGIVYELHVGTFTSSADGGPGTLDTAIERLDHLADLGVGFVELLPVNGFEGRYNWGYDGVAWYAVDAAYGGPDAYHRFVAAAHARGLGVIQDVVYNHLGPSGNYLPLFGPYLREGQANTWGDSVNLDERAVRDYLLDNAAMWFAEYGVDGLRLDAVHALLDHAEPHVLAELSAQTDRQMVELGRPLTLIAESDENDPRTITAREAGGRGLHAQWSDDYHHAVHVALTGETDGYYADFAPLSALGEAATNGFFHAGTFSTFRGRVHGAPLPPEVEAWRLVTFSQDHDQIGNRATGDRLTATLAAGTAGSDDAERRLAIAAVLTVLSPGTPMLFMGEEWAASTPWQFFTAHEDEALGRATAEGRIAEFERMGWDPEAVPDPQDPATFERSRLDWAELAEPDHARMLERYRALIALRRREPELHSPRLADLTGEWDEAARTMTLDRGAVAIRLNLGDAPWRIEASEELLFATSDDVEVAAEHLLLPPVSALVTRRVAGY